MVNTGFRALTSWAHIRSSILTMSHQTALTCPNIVLTLSKNARKTNKKKNKKWKQEKLATQQMHTHVTSLDAEGEEDANASCREDDEANI